MNIVEKTKLLYSQKCPEPIFSISVVLFTLFHPHRDPIVFLPRWTFGFKKIHFSENVSMYAPKLGRFPRYNWNGKTGKHSLEGFVEVEDGDTVLDVGAFVGEFTLPTANIADRVIAVEADPVNTYFLRLNVAEYLRHNPEKKIEVLNRAAWKVRDTLTFHRADRENPTKGSIIDSVHSGEIMEKYDVQAVRIDLIAAQLNLEKIDLLKLDAEGAEPEAIRGTTDIEIEKMVIAGGPERSDETTAEELRSILESNGYTVHISGEVANTNHDNPYMVYAKK
jgi:FkbM family methyltransferase